MDINFSDFLCGWEYHLATARLPKTVTREIETGEKEKVVVQAEICKAAVLIYSWALRLSFESESFTASPRQAGKHFKIPKRTCRYAYEQLEALGFFVVKARGRDFGESNTYKVLNHDQWAALPQNQGKCVVKMEYPWTPEADALGRTLYALSGCRIRFRDFQIGKWYRTLGLTDAEIADTFKIWFPRHQAEQEAITRETTGGNGRQWRNNVGYHFGKHLESVAGSKSAASRDYAHA
jgi:hypothetical protein